jgi:hypothetical protein
MDLHIICVYSPHDNRGSWSYPRFNLHVSFLKLRIAIFNVRADAAMFSKFWLNLEMISSVM